MDSFEYRFSQAVAVFRTLKINSIDTRYVKTSEFQVLILIRNCNRKIRAIDIAHYLNCTKVYISSIVNTLLSKKLIYKEISKEDNRQFYLYVTEKGSNIVKKYMDKYMESVSYLANHLGKEKAQMLIELLEESTAILTQYEKECIKM